MANITYASFPCHQIRELTQKLRAASVAPADKPNEMITKRIGKTRFATENKCAASSKTLLYPTQLRAQLCQYLRQLPLHGLQVVIRAKIESASVIGEFFGQLVCLRAED